MKLKRDKKFQMVGFIEDAEAERVSIVEHGANQIPFSVLKSEDQVEWVSLEKEAEEIKALKALEGGNIQLTSIQFPFGSNEEQVKNYMSRYEDDSYTIEKDQNNTYTAHTKGHHDYDETKEVILSSGVIYTLSKSDTMKTDKKENGNMSKKSKSNEKETQKKEAPVEAVETEEVETVEKSEETTETVETESKEVETKSEDTIEDLKTDLVAALKALPTEDVAAILKEVSPNEEATSADKTELETEAEATNVEETTETEEVAKTEEAAESDESAEETKEEESAPQANFQEEIDNLRKEVSAQNEKNEELSQNVAELANLVKSLVSTNEELSSKLEKSLSEEDAIEVISDLTTKVNEVTARVDSLEYAPASSEASQVEKSEEVEKQDKKAGFLSKHL